MTSIPIPGSNPIVQQEPGKEPVIVNNPPAPTPAQPPAPVQPPAPAPTVVVNN
jgi:hypothetical protein